MDCRKWINFQLKEKRSFPKTFCIYSNSGLVVSLMSSIHPVLQVAGLICLFLPLKVGALHLSTVLQPAQFLGSCFGGSFFRVEVAQKIVTDLSMSVYTELDSHFSDKRGLQALTPGLGVQCSYAFTQLGSLQVHCAKGIARSSQVGISLHWHLSHAHSPQPFAKSARILKDSVFKLNKACEGDGNKMSSTDAQSISVFEPEGAPIQESVADLSLVSDEAILKKLETHFVYTARTLKKLKESFKAPTELEDNSDCHYDYNEVVFQFNRLDQMLGAMKNQLSSEKSAIESVYELPNLWANLYYLLGLFRLASSSADYETLFKACTQLGKLESHSINLSHLVITKLSKVDPKAVMQGSDPSENERGNEAPFSIEAILNWLAKARQNQTDPADLFADFYWKKWLKYLESHPEFISSNKLFERHIHLTAYEEYKFYDKLHQVYTSKRDSALCKQTDQVLFKSVSLQDKLKKKVDDEQVAAFERLKKTTSELEKIEWTTLETEFEQSKAILCSTVDAFETAERQESHLRIKNGQLEIQIATNTTLSAMREFRNRRRF